MLLKLIINAWIKYKGTGDWKWNCVAVLNLKSYLYILRKINSNVSNHEYSIFNLWSQLRYIGYLISRWRIWEQNMLQYQLTNTAWIVKVPFKLQQSPLPFLSLSGWIFSQWFIISLGLICQHSEDTYLIFWNSERDQPPHNLFHLSFRTAAHDERRFMLNEYICHCPWCLDYMNMT